MAYLLLGVSYLLVTPPLESSDEYKHYPVVKYMQTEHSLAVLDPENPGMWLQEGAQPPLYYLLMAGLTSWINTSDLPKVHHKNLYAFIGNPNQIRNKNLVIHDPAREQFPWQGTILAINLIRPASIGLGLGTIWLTIWPTNMPIAEPTSLYFRPEFEPGRYQLRWRLANGSQVIGGRPFWRPWAGDANVLGEIRVKP
ncbi:MAG: hypothetical protein H6667_17450 [Ardenticatenaceae bacterium]|nr:hypothetical protein [Ardenticatenaceae bacterium]MCB9443240.1 hypothetical protein [Ardenticatenaceae bacterium]